MSIKAAFKKQAIIKTILENLNALIKYADVVRVC